MYLLLILTTFKAYILSPFFVISLYLLLIPTSPLTNLMIVVTLVLFWKLYRIVQKCIASISTWIKPICSKIFLKFTQKAKTKIFDWGLPYPLVYSVKTLSIIATAAQSQNLEARSLIQILHVRDRKSYLCPLAGRVQWKQSQDSYIDSVADQVCRPFSHSAIRFNDAVSSSPLKTWYNCHTINIVH